MSATIIGSTVAGAVIGQGTCLLLVMAIMSNHVESATLVFRHTTDVLTFGMYCSMETYDETVTSLTQKRDLFKSGQIISARRSTHKTA